MATVTTFKQARWFRRGRQSKTPRLIGVHCTVSKEMGTGAEAVAAYFATTTRKASTHLVADDNSVVRCVLDDDTAYAAGGANTDGLHLELVGMPDQSLAQWLDPFGKAMFAAAAPEVRTWMRKYTIPARWLTIDQIRDGRSRGFATHADIEKAFPSTGHWDPGPNFPRAEFLAAITGTSPITPPQHQEDDMAVILRVNANTPNPADDQYAVSDYVEKRPVTWPEIEPLQREAGLKVVDVSKVVFDGIPNR